MLAEIFFRRIPVAGVNALLAVATFCIASHKIDSWMLWVLACVGLSLLVSFSLIVKIFREKKLENGEGMLSLVGLILLNVILVAIFVFPMMDILINGPLNEELIVGPATFWVWILCAGFSVAALVGFMGGFDPSKAVKQQS